MEHCGLPPHTALSPSLTASSHRRTASALEWSTLRSELLWVYEGPVAEPSLSVESDHRHGYWVWLLRRGGVHVRMGGDSCAAHAGQWLVSPRRVVEQRFTPDAVILSVHFRCQWPDGEDFFHGREGIIFESSQFPDLERSATSLKRVIHRHFPDVRVQYLQQTIEFPVFIQFQQRFLQWLAEFYHVMLAQNQSLVHVGEGDERVWRAVRILRECALNQPFPAEHLQRETSLGRAHLDRIFSETLGLSTRDYWQQLRQEYALQGLSTRTLSIKEIGYHLGFKQPCHFTIWFSRRLGLSPQEYRTRAAESPHIVADLIPRS